MAFDVTRQFLGQALQQKLLQQTPAYKQQLLEGELKNRMMAMEMDEMFPLKMQMLQKEMEYMVDPMAKLQAQQLMEYKSREAIENLRAQHMEALAVMRGEQDRMTKATPSVTYNYGDPNKNDVTGIKTAQSNIRILQGRLKGLKKGKEGWNAATQSWEKSFVVPKENVPAWNESVEQLRLQYELAGMPIEADEYAPIEQSQQGLVVPQDATTTAAVTPQDSTGGTWNWATP